MEVRTRARTWLQNRRYLIWLRIEMARKLAEVAKAHDLKWERESIGMLITALRLHELSTELLHAVMVLSDVLNRVGHGQRISLARPNGR